MEFHEKLQYLRKQNGLTQDELAKALFVSRAAVSKWESGKGYPNIESLKIIAEFFGLTVDELLSSNQLLTIAEEDTRQKENRLRDLVFGLLDVSYCLLFSLPFFANRTGNIIEEVSLLSLNAVSPLLKSVFFVLVSFSVIWGVLTLALQNCQNAFWVRNKGKISLLLNAVCTISFVLGLQPYASIFLFVFLIIKVLILTKKR